MMHTSRSFHVCALRPQLCMSMLIVFHASPCLDRNLSRSSTVACWHFTLWTLTLRLSSTARSSWASSIASWCGRGIVIGDNSRLVSSKAYGGAEGGPYGMRHARSMPTSPSIAFGKAERFSRRPVSTSESNVGSGRPGKSLSKASMRSGFEEGSRKRLL